MGLFGDVFDAGKGFLGKLNETLQDTGWAIAAPVATAFDLARAGLDNNPETTFGSALSTGINRGTQLLLGDNAGTPDVKTDDTQNLISPGVGKVMDGLEWLYDNAIAQPINTANIVSERAMADITGTEDNQNLLDIGSAWKRADEKTGGYDGKGTSIGREWANTVFGIRDFLPTNWGRDGQFSSLTDEGQRILDTKSKEYDIVSGAVDATGRLVLDPTIVLGKASKALKFEAYIRGIKDVPQLEKFLDETKHFGGLFDSFGNRQRKAVDFNMGIDQKAPRSAAEIYAANPGLQAAGGDGWALAHGFESASRDLFKANATPEEMRAQGNLLALAGIGDPYALKGLDDKVAAARDALASVKSQRDDLGRARDWAMFQNGPVAKEAATSVARQFVDDVANMGQDYLQSDEFLAMTNERLKAVLPQFRAAQQEVARVEKFRASMDSVQSALRDQPMLASTGFLPLGRTSNTAGMARRAAKEAGRREPSRLDFIFQSSPFNKAVKIAVPASRFLAPHIYYGAKAYKAFGQAQAPRVIEMHDENAPLALNNFLKHSAVDGELRESLVSELAGARTEGAKRNVVTKAIQHAQSSMIEKYKIENPHFNEATAATVITEQAKQIQQEADRIGLQTRKFTAHTKQDGMPGDAVIDPDTGHVIYQPLLDTQLENQVVLPDLRAFTKILDRHSGWLNDMAEWAQGNRVPDAGRVKQLSTKFFDKAVEMRPGLDVRTAKRAQNAALAKWKLGQYKDQGLTGLTKAWKYSLLLRPAYPMRVLADSDMRALAVLGPQAFAMHFSPRAFGFLTMGGASRTKTAFAAHADGIRLREIKTDLENFEGKWKSVSDEPIVDEHYADLKKQGEAIEKRLETYRNGGRKGRNEAYGRFGEVGQKDIQTVAGNIKGAFADDYGRMMRHVISSKTTAGLMGDSQKLEMASLMSENWTSLTSSDAGHMDAWIHGINAQLKQSVLGKKALEFQARNGDDPERAVAALQNWLRNTAEGREIKGRMAWDAANGEQKAREVVGMVNHYLPSEELRTKALSDRITQQDLEALYPDPLDRPPVHGQSLARALGRGSLAGKAINDWFSRTMRWLSDAPEDQLARHPMYAAVYEQEAKRQAEWLWSNPHRTDIGLDEIHKQVQQMAHKKAQRAIKTYMFDTATQSDLSHALRFTSPFIAAWEDTVKKWGKIAMDDPSIIGKGYLAWNAPADMGLVVDQDGHPVKEHDFNSQSYLLMQAPSWAPLIGGKKLPIANSNFRIPMQSFNIILQGGLQPGFGPLVAIPVAKLQIDNPELDDVAKFVNPYGPPASVWDAVAPSTAKRVAELVNTQSRSHMYDTQRIYMQDLADYRQDPEKFGNKPPTWESAASKAKAVGILKIVNNFANPFPAIFDSKYKLYQDAYRDLQNKERTDNHEQGWADDQFIKGYGESFFPLVQSMSKNNAGLAATGEAVNASKKYKSEIAKYGMEAGDPNKTLIRLIVGDEGEGAYNQSAHRWQETREISPASGVNFRDVSKSQEAAANADADLGWYKYRQFQNLIDAQANDQGLRSYSESDDLVAAKKEFVQNLKNENPSWEVDYDQMDPQKFARDIKSLGEAATSDKFGAERTDIAGVRQYLTLRQALEEQLQMYGISAGSQDALPLKQAFTDEVMNIVGSNTKFAEWAFHPFLERDPLLADITPQSGIDPAVTTAQQWGFS